MLQLGQITVQDEGHTILWRPGSTDPVKKCQMPEHSISVTLQPLEKLECGHTKPSNCSMCVDLISEIFVWKQTYVMLTLQKALEAKKTVFSQMAAMAGFWTLAGNGEKTLWVYSVRLNRWSACCVHFLRQTNLLIEFVFAFSKPLWRSVFPR